MRFLYVGIDYGTCWSKMVVRDLQAPGGDRADVVMLDGDHRISSTVVVHQNRLMLTPGREWLARPDVRRFESVKMRLAADVTGNQAYLVAPRAEFPGALNAKDLAVLTVWALMSKCHVDGHAFRAAWVLGVPMHFFDDPRLRQAFYDVATGARHLYDTRGACPSDLAVGDAEALAREARQSVAAVPEDLDELRQELRPEAEAAVWWAFKSPSTDSDHPYAKIDVGAGTTNVSLFRMPAEAMRLGEARRKGHLSFHSSASVAAGMDQVDADLAKALGLPPEQALSLRGTEANSLRDYKNGRACEHAFASIRQGFLDAWKAMRDKNMCAKAEWEKWKSCRVFWLGGGGRIEALRQVVGVHPTRLGGGPPLERQDLEAPGDLWQGKTKVDREALPDLLVAYGLANPDPVRAVLPPDVPPMEPDLRIEMAPDQYTK